MIYGLLAQVPLVKKQISEFIFAKDKEIEGYIEGDICDDGFSGIEDARFLREASVSYRRSKLRMHNFNGKHPHIIENVGCRCKIYEGSILRF